MNRNEFKFSKKGNIQKGRRNSYFKNDIDLIKGNLRAIMNEKLEVTVDNTFQPIKKR